MYAHAERAAGAWRTLSLVGASGLCLAFLVRPQWLAGDPPSHLLAMFGCLGLCALFVHGVGFEPKARALRVLTSAWTAWALALSPLVVRLF